MQSKNQSTKLDSILKSSTFLKACATVILNTPVEKNISAIVQNIKIENQGLLNSVKDDEVDGSQESKNDAEKGNLVCTRKMGCQCQQCNEFSMGTQTDETAEIVDAATFSKANMSKQVAFICKESIKFNEMFENLSNENICSFETTFKQETFLTAINKLILSNHQQMMAILGLICSNSVQILLNLAWGVSDNMRWRAFQILIHLASIMAKKSQNPDLKNQFGKFELPYDDEKARSFSDKIYCQAYDVDQWVYTMADITPKTDILILNVEEQAFLYEACKKIRENHMVFVNKSRQTSGGLKAPESWFQDFQGSNEPIAQQLVQRVLDAIKNIGGGDFFMKLSTRSPKDSKILRDRASKIDITCEEPKEAQILKDIYSLKVSNVYEALDLFCLSQRIEEDLETHLQFGNSLSDGAPMSLILREWAIFNPMYEIRSFVCNRKLTCATQYQEDVQIKWMQNNRKAIGEALQKFFYSKVEPTLTIDQSVIDFALITEISDKTGEEVIKDIFVIELNSFGFRTGSNLFDWGDEEDYNVMVNGPFEFRVEN